MNDVARQVASQYRRDTMSPIMVSGVLRMVEFALLFLSGLCVYFHYVGFFNYLAWQYPLTIAAASFLAVVLLDVSDCYQVVALMRPIANFGRILLVWAGSLRADGVDRLRHEDVGGLFAPACSAPGSSSASSCSSVSGW